MEFDNGVNRKLIHMFLAFYYKNTHHYHAFDHFPYHTFNYHGKKYHQLYLN